MKNIVLIGALLISGLFMIKVIQADFSHKGDGHTLRQNQIHNGFTIWDLCKDKYFKT